MMPGVWKAWLAHAGSTGTYLFPDIALGAGSAVLSVPLQTPPDGFILFADVFVWMSDLTSLELLRMGLF